MKKLTYLFVLLMSMISVVSCNEDDLVDLLNNEDSKALIGTWEYLESDDEYEEVITLTFNNNFSGLLEVKYTEDGYSESDTQEFTWGTDGKNLTLDLPEGLESLSYSISGNKLRITDEDGDLLIFTKK